MKPIGSDYILTEDSSDLVNENMQEDLIKINEWLIELKATRKSDAMMTHSQAKMAVEKKNNYALIVVPLDNSEPDIEFIRNNAKVVENIGCKLSNTVENFSGFESRKDELTNEVNNGISVNIDESNAKFKVDSSVWEEHGISIDEFINNHFGKK